MVFEKWSILGPKVKFLDDSGYRLSGKKKSFLKIFPLIKYLLNNLSYGHKTAT